MNSQDWFNTDKTPSYLLNVFYLICYRSWRKACTPSILLVFRKSCEWGWESSEPFPKATVHPHLQTCPKPQPQCKLPTQRLCCSLTSQCQIMRMSSCAYSKLFFKIFCMSYYGFSVPKSIPKWRCCIFKGELIFRIKLEDNFCHTLKTDSLKCDSFLWPGEPGWENCFLQQMSREERNNILDHHFLLMTTVTRQRRKIRGWELCSVSVGAYPKASVSTPTGLCHYLLWLILQ